MTISSLVPRVEFRQTTSHFGSTGGYMSRNAAQVLYLLDTLQKIKEVSGDILEVGAYQGRGSILFSYLLKQHETLHVSDLFDRQDLNLSASMGLGRKEWEKNFLMKRQISTSVVIHEGPSQELDTEALGASFRLTYLDGGHSAAEVFSDLKLAEGIMISDGVAIVDDVFNEDFPGTSEGVVEYVRASGLLVPWFCFEGKVALAEKSAAESYRELVLSSLDTGEHWMAPEQVFCGRHCLILKFRGRWELASLRIKKASPGLHRVVSKSEVAKKVFHRLRGATKYGQR